MSTVRKYREGQPIEIKGVEVFPAGMHRGKLYTEKDLDDIVTNFDRYCTGGKPQMQPPAVYPGFVRDLLAGKAVVGHEEEADQELLKRSDLPAAAWPKRLYRNGKILMADLGEVAPSVARAIKGRAYRKVSAEIYDQPPEGVPGTGKMLRRISFLGGEVPQCKTLADIPVPEFSEQFDDTPAPKTRIRFDNLTAPTPERNYWTCFSELVRHDERTESAMSRQEILQALQAAGIDVSKVTDAMPDEFLASVLQVVSDEGEEEPEPTDEEIAALPPEKKKEMADMYSAKAAKYGAVCNKNADGTDVPPIATDGVMHDQPPANPSGVQPKKVTHTMQFTEEVVQGMINTTVSKAVGDAVKTLEAKAGSTQAELEKFREDTVLATKRENVEKFIEDYRKSGHIEPWEDDHTRPGGRVVFDRLMRADHVTPIAKFKEGRKEVSITAYDQELNAIKNRSPKRFSEKVGGGKGKPGDTTDDEVSQVEAHYESFAEDYEGYTTKEEFVNGFKNERKHKPKLTAEQYCNRGK